MSGAIHVDFQDLKNSQNEVTEKETRIREFETELKNLKISQESEVSGLQDQLKKEKDRAEKESRELSQKDEEAVIAKFKQSEEYDQAIANAGAPEIEHCWIIIERHIKTNPGANWATFVDEFLAAKENIEIGLGEPEPYDGPSPAFLPGTPPRDSA